DEEFKRDAVRMLESRGRTVRQLAAELGVSAWSLKRWAKLYGEGSAAGGPPGGGGPAAADAAQHLVAKHVAAASQTCLSMAKKSVTPHVLRHTAAMELLQAGVDRSLIAIWLGHESPDSTQIYLDANLALKEAILAKTNPLPGKPGRYRPDDRLLDFLKAL
ncbi:MAG: tyrosine-type recombinase/integrase, partial [Chthoniobacterales bacterium]